MSDPKPNVGPSLTRHRHPRPSHRPNARPRRGSDPRWPQGCRLDPLGIQEARSRLLFKIRGGGGCGRDPPGRGGGYPTPGGPKKEGLKKIDPENGPKVTGGGPPGGTDIKKKPGLHRTLDPDSWPHRSHRYPHPKPLTQHKPIGHRPPSRANLSRGLCTASKLL